MHPNTIRVFDFGTSATGLFYYAMELLEGTDLIALVKAGPMTPRRAIDIAVQICHSLAEAHARGIVHRDIKPGNIFITEVAGRGDHVKVLDFGLAKVIAPELSGQTDEPLTRVGWAVGTPAYMAPETAAGLESDARTDVYSLGTLLFVMLTAKLPFRTKNQRDVLKMKMLQDPPRVSETLGRAMPRGLDEAVEKAMARQPEERFGTVLELAAALTACLDVPLAAPATERVALDESGATLVEDRPGAIS